jgi:hypothetical protein
VGVRMDDRLREDGWGWECGWMIDFARTVGAAQTKARRRLGLASGKPACGELSRAHAT